MGRVRLSTRYFDVTLTTCVGSERCRVTYTHRNGATFSFYTYRHDPWVAARLRR